MLCQIENRADNPPKREERLSIYERVILHDIVNSQLDSTSRMNELLTPRDDSQVTIPVYHLFITLCKRENVHGMGLVECRRIFTLKMMLF